jgi:hypothetical protein
LFDFFAPEGVLVLEVAEAGVDVPDCDGFTSAGAGADDSEDGCVGEALRLVGGSNCSVADSCSLSSATVLEGSNGLPSIMRRASGERVVEADRNSRMFETVWTGLMFSLMATVRLLAVEPLTPESSRSLLLSSQILTLMEMLSADSSLLEMLEATEPDLEREAMMDVGEMVRRGR